MHIETPQCQGYFLKFQAHENYLIFSSFDQMSRYWKL
jgi:hypothetical protein